MGAKIRGVIVIAIRMSFVLYWINKINTKTYGDIKQQNAIVRSAMKTTALFQ